VRTLAADIGLESDGFTLDQALTLAELEALTRRNAQREALVPMARALAGMTEVAAGPELLAKIRHGALLTRDDLGGNGRPAEAEGAFLKVLDEAGELAAVLECRAESDTLKYAGVFLGPGR